MSCDEENHRAERAGGEADGEAQTGGGSEDQLFLCSSIARLYPCPLAQKQNLSSSTLLCEVGVYETADFTEVRNVICLFHSCTLR
jgi:hypothetical protein